MIGITEAEGIYVQMIKEAVKRDEKYMDGGKFIIQKYLEDKNYTGLEIEQLNNLWKEFGIYEKYAKEKKVVVLYKLLKIFLPIIAILILGYQFINIWVYLILVLIATMFIWSRYAKMKNLKKL